MPFPPHRCSALLLPVALALTSPAGATDGVIELNDARATAGGITPGDAPGYPVSITASGSYRLTGDLFTSGTNISAVVITASNVTLDLNGFTIKCLFFGPLCAGNGTGVGIDASAQTNVTVRNGTVRDMGAAAIDLGTGGRVEQVRAIANGSGIKVLAGEIDDCLAMGNIGSGMIAVETAVRDSESRQNPSVWNAEAARPRRADSSGTCSPAMRVHSAVRASRSGTT